jgi:hypothetical protein
VTCSNSVTVSMSLTASIQSSIHFTRSISVNKKNCTFTSSYFKSIAATMFGLAYISCNSRFIHISAYSCLKCANLHALLVQRFNCFNFFQKQAFTRYVNTCFESGLLFHKLYFLTLENLILFYIAACHKCNKSTAKT